VRRQLAADRFPRVRGRDRDVVDEAETRRKATGSGQKISSVLKDGTTLAQSSRRLHTAATGKSLTITHSEIKPICTLLLPPSGCKRTPGQGSKQHQDDAANLFGPCVASSMTDVQVLSMFLFWFENGQTTAPKTGVEICHRTGAIGRGLPSLSFW